MKTTCDNCRFFDSDCCRRYPPTAVTEVDGCGDAVSHVAQFPVVASSEWCGEWKP